VALAVLLAGAVTSVVAWRRSSKVPETTSSVLQKSEAPAASAPEGGATPSLSANAESGGPIPDLEGSAQLAIPPADFSRLPDGGVIPRLPDSAPKEVNFGVILVSYQGAELAPKNARSRQAALKNAQDLIPQAKVDFAEAAKLGDRGSNANAGQIPRGVLERAVEYVLFTLAVGAVYPEPVDTPRGFWVVKRNK